MQAGVPEIYRFGAFTLDRGRGQVIGSGGPVPLRPKSFALLCHLVEHAGRLLPKDEIGRAVWGDVTVTDESIARCVSDVRTALGDQHQQLIKTMPGRGYLFVATVDRVADGSPPQTAPDDTWRPPVSDMGPRSQQETVPRDLFGGERKLVTVLYADVKEALERCAEHDPEEALNLFEAVLKLMTQAVHQYEGTVNLVTADGIVALFGVPLAHEDHALCACNAALQLQQAVERYSNGLRAEASTPVRVRAGLNSG